MQQPTIEQLRELMESTQSPCVSLYMPTHPGIAENQQDRTRFKNLLRQAQRGLEKANLRSPVIQDIMQEAIKLSSDGLFWRRQNHGLAMFMAKEHFSFHQLPLKVDELVMVTDRFHLKPLMQLVGQEQFYVLALSLKSTRLLEGNEHGLSALPAEVPMTMEEFLEGEEREPHLEYRSFSIGGRGRQMATYHGHGAGGEDSKEDLRRYCRYIDGVVTKRLAGKRLPLTLVGVDYLLPIYREVNTYPQLARVHVEGNPDEFGPEQLHQRAWSSVKPQLLEERQEAIEHFQELMGTGKASTSVEEVALAAHHGRVEILFVPLGVQRPGLIKPEEQTVELVTDGAAGEYPDLLDQAAIGTLDNGGTVYVVDQPDMPNGVDIAAIFRY